MDENTKQSSVSSPEEQEIDLLELAGKVWAERRLVLKWCGVAVVVALVVGFSIPKEYTTTVMLAPEVEGGSRSLGGLSALAGMAGINVNAGESSDALYPELYPDIVSSVGFTTELFPVFVEDEEGELKTTLYNYLKEEQRSPWWSAILSFPFKCIGWITSLFRDEEEENVGQGIDPFRLTKDETGVVKMLNERISVSVDKKTSVITLSVTMQDPLISATMTDTVMQKLQNYITEYRTNKARHDLDFTQKLYDEAQKKYYVAQQAYADYVDMNQNISLRSVQTRQERLQNEMNLAYNLYNQTAQQLQLAKAKVQENTPVYTIVQAATVPLKASKPSKLMILVGFVFLAGVMSVGWVLFGKGLWSSLKQSIHSEEKSRT